MPADGAVETVLPREVREGDVIRDPAAARWFTVNEIQVVSGEGSGVFSFYDESPDDAVTVAGDEPVTRRR
ncbi:hypothetical protein [Mycolicibacterium brisbanense]|uniref:DNA modification methylase n=1 Tax=Mycolicibacterium brisbanense TaxID=146020 RepID=A0A100W4Y5_9MYCO|nr:hypothetical protein [Mycolicibacterium brisbanense]MCV7160315.1 hypothetical protein [Mycolicibacterium brisbanense]GAS91705.1 DNA modification methylase [Mycolicibacterium brisbanense]